MVRLLHLADLHLDSPFRGVHGASERAAEVLRDASLLALERAVDRALELHAGDGLDAVTIAGDVFDAGTPSLRARHRFTQQLARLAEVGLPVLVVTGNHDPVDDRRTWGRLALPVGCRVLSAAWDQEPLYQDGHLAAVVVGRSYTAADRDTDPLVGLPQPAAPLRIGLLHTDVDGPSDEHAYAPVRLQALRDSGYDAWLLGHLHRQQTLCEQPLVAYAGTPQGRDPGPGELGPKGALLVELEPGRPAAATMVLLAPVRRAEVSVAVDGCTSDQEVAERVLARLAAEEEPELLGLVARVTLTGRLADGPLWAQWTGPEGAAELTEALTEAQGPPFRLIESLRLTLSGPVPDRAALAERGDLLGDFARLLDEATEPDSAAAQAVAEALSLVGQSGAGLAWAREAGWPPEPGALLARAEQAVLARLAPLLEQGADQ